MTLPDRARRAWAAALFALVEGCEGRAVVGAAGEAPLRRWQCPAGWVEAEFGGCGPGAVLCAPDGGGVRAACAATGSNPPPPVPVADGGTVAGFRLLPDGSLGGAWPEPGDPDGPPDDAWTPDTPGDDLTPEVPAEGWRPTAGVPSCLAGWSRLGDGACDPQLRADCAGGSAALPGGQCVPTASSSCPPDEYADVRAEAAGARRLHVRADASAGGADGSLERPFSTLAAALAGARAGDWILLARGEYREALVAPPFMLHVVGACAARVTLRPERGAGVVVDGAGAILDLRGVAVQGGAQSVRVTAGTLRGVAVRLVAGEGGGVLASGGAARADLASVVIESPGGPGVAVERGASVTLRGSAVLRARGEGVRAGGAGANLSLVGSTVRDTQVDPMAVAAAVSAYTGAQLTASAVALVGNPGAGLRVDGAGASATLTDVTVSDTRASAAGQRGDGLVALAGAALHARRVTVRRSVGAGIQATGAGTRVDVADCAVMDTTAPPGAVAGYAVVVNGRAELEATGVSALRSAGAAVSVADVGTRATLTRMVVATTRRVRTPGGALLVGNRASADVSELLVTDVDDAGIVLASGGSLTLARGLLRDVHGGGQSGYGVIAGQGSTLRARGLAVVRAALAGLAARDAQTRVELEGAVVRCGDAPVGAVVGAAASLRLAEVVIRERCGVGVSVEGDGTRAELTSLVVLSEPKAGAGAARSSLQVIEGAQADAAGILLRGGTQAGVLVSGEGTRVTLRRARIASVQSDRGDDGAPAGAGVNVNDGAAVELTETLVEEIEGVGVGAYGAGTTLTVTGSAVRDGRHYFPRNPRVPGGVGVAVVDAVAQLTAVDVARFAHRGVVASGGGRVTLDRCAIRDTVVDGAEPGAVGVVVASGARLVARASSVVATGFRGVAAQGAGSAAELVGCRVEGIRDVDGGAYGWGISVMQDAVLDVRGSVVRGAREFGIDVRAATATLRDVIVMDVAPTRRGFGLGVNVSDGALDAARLAVIRCAGGGVVSASLPDDQRAQLGTGPRRARVRAEDLLVRGVRPSTIRFAQTGDTFMPVGDEVAYGVHAGAGAALDLTRFTLSDASLGFYNAGELELREGVIVDQRVGFGAAAPMLAPSATRVAAVSSRGNARSALLSQALPESATLPVSESICAVGACD